MLGQPLRAAGVGQACVQDGFHQRKFGRTVRQADAADHVADDKHVGLQGQLVGAKTFDQIDAQGPQLVAHRRVNASVATRHLVACLARERGQAAHERAADAQYVYMHGRRF